MAGVRLQKSRRLDDRLVEWSGGRLPWRRGRLAEEWNLHDEIRWTIRIDPREERHRDVVDGHAGRRAPLRGAAMRVAVKDGADAIAIDRLFETARSEIRVDLER